MAETGTTGQMMNPGHAGKAIASVSLSKALNPPQTSGYIGCTGQLPVGMDVTGVKQGVAQKRPNMLSQPSFLPHIGLKLLNLQYFTSGASCVVIFGVFPSSRRIQTQQQESVNAGSTGEKPLQLSLSCLLRAISQQGGFKTQP